MKDFKDKVAVVTGAASGVGKSIAAALGKEGAKVVLSDVEVGALDKAVSELTALGYDCIGLQGDVTKPESLEALAQGTLEKYGAMHLVFANAGVGTGEGGNMWEYDVNDWEWGFRVNTWGLINTINAFVPKLVAQNQEAHFVVTGSANGAFLMLPNTPIYTVSKAAVQAITESLYFQLDAVNPKIKVNALFPGPNVVRTGIFNSERNRPDDLPVDPNKPDSGITSVEDMEAMMEQFNMKLDTTHPDEVAETCLQGLRDERFWILPLTDKARAAVKQRTDNILDFKNPEVPMIL